MSHQDKDGRIDIGRVQKLRKYTLAVAIAAGLGVGLFTRSPSVTDGPIHEAIEYAGMALILACILGRGWCAAYIGGLKNRELVTLGPYSMSRNPLYFFSILGAAGVGAQFGSLTLALLAAAITYGVFAVVVHHEEELQDGLHGEDYRLYRATVPRFLPRLAAWQEPATLLVNTRAVRVTLLDSLVFLLSLPVAEGIEHLQTTGLLSVYIHLP